MGIKLKTEEGAEISFDTVAEFMEFKKQMDEEEASKETESAVEEDTSDYEPVIPGSSPKFEVGDEVRVVENKSAGHVDGTIGEITEVRYVGREDRWSYVVRPISDCIFEFSLSHKETDLEICGNEIEVGDKVIVVSAEDGSRIPYHGFSIGSTGEVLEVYGDGKLEVLNGTLPQTLLPHHYEKVEPLGKDANGENLYEGDFVTGTEDNKYGSTNDKAVMEVLGAGESYFFEEANIKVKIVGYCTEYSVDSSKFLKLSDNLDKAKDMFDEIKGEEDVEVVEDKPEFKIGDKVEVVGNRAGHDMDEGEVRVVYGVDYAEPKYNLSQKPRGSWAHSEDIKLAEETQGEIEEGDLVYVNESFTDSYGDTAKEGTCAKIRRSGDSLFLSGVLVENKSQLDKLVLVAKKEDISI